MVMERWRALRRMSVDGLETVTLAQEPYITGFDKPTLHTLLKNLCTKK